MITSVTVMKSYLIADSVTIKDLKWWAKNDYNKIVKHINEQLSIKSIKYHDELNKTANEQEGRAWKNTIFILLWGLKNF